MIYPLGNISKACKEIQPTYGSRGNSFDPCNSNRIAYFQIIGELSNMINKNNVASTVTQKLHGRVEMAVIKYNGAPKWHTKQY